MEKLTKNSCEPKDFKGAVVSFGGLGIVPAKRPHDKDEWAAKGGRVPDEVAANMVYERFLELQSVPKNVFEAGLTVVNADPKNFGEKGGVPNWKGFATIMDTIDDVMTDPQYQTGAVLENQKRVISIDEI